MWLLGVVLIVGVALTVRWSGVAYRPWDATPDGGGAGPPPPRAVARTYLRGTAVALVGGFWAGLLVTGPAVRLAMRLLAVTSDESAQGRLTEADEVVGAIDLGGTVGLVLFGGVLPGLLSGALYVVLRRLLPGGRLAGVAFGALHLLLGATRIDPLRPDNPDFDLLGPGWLAVVTFGATAILHGMAVVAIANRYSTALPPQGDRRWVAVLPPVLPVLLLVPGAPVLVPIVVGLVAAVVVTRSTGLTQLVRSTRVVDVGRVAVVAVAVVLLPGTLLGLRDVVVRDGDTAASTVDAP